MNFCVGNRIKKVEHKEMQCADKRLGIIRQVINDIKPIKLCSWEESFMEKIFEARKEECKHMRRFRILYQGVSQLARAVPFLAACPTFVYMAATGEELVAADIFAALTVFMSLRLVRRSLLSLPPRWAPILTNRLAAQALACRWDTLDLKLTERVRRGFHGAPRASPVTGAPELYYPSWKRWAIHYPVSAIVTCAMLAVAFCVMCLSLNLQGYVHPGSPIFVQQLAHYAAPGGLFDPNAEFCPSKFCGTPA